MTDKTELKRLDTPIGWFTDDHLTDKSATTYDKAVADRWCEKGWPVQALYDGAAVLALIAENEALTARINDMHADRVEAVSEIVVQGLEVDQLQAEVERLKTENQSEVGACLLSVAENKKLQAENEALRKDAERYRWLRGQHWNESEMAVVRHPKKAVKLGFDCPSEGRLDCAIDAALGKGEQS